MQLFPQATNSAKNYDSSAYNNSQSNSAKDMQQLQDAGQKIAQLIAMIFA